VLRDAGLVHRPTQCAKVLGPLNNRATAPDLLPCLSRQPHRSVSAAPAGISRSRTCSPLGGFRPFTTTEAVHYYLLAWLARGLPM
jgi:hypothetical protein